MWMMSFKGIGGVWLDKPTFQLNSVGLKLNDILNRNRWLKFMMFKETREVIQIQKKPATLIWSCTESS